MLRVPFISCFALLAVAACGGRDPVDDNAAAKTTGLPDVNVPAPSATGEPRGPTSPAKVEPTPAASIPAALQGRWGLTPADCMPGQSDAKGLLTITANDLRFYESRAVPAGNVDTDANSISGDCWVRKGTVKAAAMSRSARLRGLRRHVSAEAAPFGEGGAPTGAGVKMACLRGTAARAIRTTGALRRAGEGQNRSWGPTVCEANVGADT